MLLKGKVVLVTGATKGIGRSVCELFAMEGAKVVLTGRNESELLSVAKGLMPNPDQHLILQMDVNDPISIKSAFDYLKSSKINLDVLVNNAGIMIDSTLQMVRPDVISNTFQSNVFGTILVTQSALGFFFEEKIWFNY